MHTVRVSLGSGLHQQSWCSPYCLKRARRLQATNLNSTVASRSKFFAQSRFWASSATYCRHFEDETDPMIFRGSADLTTGCLIGGRFIRDHFHGSTTGILPFGQIFGIPAATRLSRSVPMKGGFPNLRAYSRLLFPFRCPLSRATATYSEYASKKAAKSRTVEG